MSGAGSEATVGSRLLSLSTALGQDVLAPVAARLEEAISAPYSAVVECVSDSATVDPDSLLCQPACLKLVQDGVTRILHGMVSAVEATGEPQRGRYGYTLTLVPRLWFMGQTGDCRIFTNVAFADIVTTLCGEAGQTLDLKVYGTRTPRPYVTQYNETDLAFLQRLLEEAGYFYVFEHAEGDHTLVVTDRNQGFPQGATAMGVVAQGTATGVAGDVLTDWRRVGRTVQGQVRLADYNPLTPSTLPDATQATTLSTAGATKRDVYAWPAGTDTQDDASARARLRMEAQEAQAALMHGRTGAHTLMPGARIALSQDPAGGSDVEYVVRSVETTARDSGWVTGRPEASCQARLAAFPSATPWRDRLLTPRPAMGGVHAAVVLGGSGEEIHADQYGRIKVRFFWDHRADATADNACWVRVVQPWSGNTWGWQHLPRVGTEVAVCFLDADPDRPVVMGGLYNATMMPPFAVPGEQTKSGLRSRSTANGSTSTFSELSFDDKTGSEMVLLHAEKDLTHEVENDETATIGHDQSLTVKHDQTVAISNDQSITVSGNRTLSVTKKETVEIDDAQSVTVKGGRTTAISSSGDALTVDSGGITSTAKTGDVSIKAQAGSIKLDALTSIELTVGSNSVKIDMSGVTISATMVKVTGDAMVKLEAPMAQVNADGMLMLKGGITMLN